MRLFYVESWDVVHSIFLVVLALRRTISFWYTALPVHIQIQINKYCLAQILPRRVIYWWFSNKKITDVPLKDVEVLFEITWHNMLKSAILRCSVLCRGYNTHTHTHTKTCIKRMVGDALVTPVPWYRCIIRCLLLLIITVISATIIKLLYYATLVGSHPLLGSSLS